MIINNLDFTIKSIVIKNIMESSNPAFYLAPDIVGSINNAYVDKQKNHYVVDFNTTDSFPMKLMVPLKTYSNWDKSNSNIENKAMAFTKAFFQDVKHCERDEMLGEIVDEFGNLYNDSQDLPANTKGDPGYYNKKSGKDAKKQYISAFSRVSSPTLGYGGVTW